MSPRDTRTLRKEARPNRNKDPKSLEIEERRRAHIVTMYARNHIRFDGALSQYPYIDNASCAQLEVSDTDLVTLLSREGV